MCIRLLAVFVLSLFSFIELAFGCTCAPRLSSGNNTIRDLVASQVGHNGQKETIFEGVVERQEIKSGPIGPPSSAMSITFAGVHRIVTIGASRVYRGANARVFTVITGMGLGDCGFDFRTGRGYLVFATQIEGGAYFTSICTGTVPLERSGPAVRLLRGEAPAPEDLLDAASYYQQMSPKWTGGVCGKVTGPDGKPVEGASIDLTELRKAPYPQNRGSELSSAEGSFCIENVSPGKYLLTAWKTDYDKWTRLMGFYPGVSTHADALPIEVKAETTLASQSFKLRNEKLYKIRIRVVTSDGSSLPWGQIGVAVKSANRDPLAYDEDHGVAKDGSWTFGYIPVGHYEVISYGHQPSKWRQDKREVEVTGDTEVVLKITP